MDILYMALVLIFTRSALAGPIDQNATAETKALFEGLIKVARNPNQIIFGQHRATVNGIYGHKAPYRQGNNGGWRYTQKMSLTHEDAELCDIKAVTGEYPGLLGENLKDLAQDDLDVILEVTRQAYKLGIVNTLHMAMSNPATGGPSDIEEDTGNTTHSIRRILPNGENHTNYVAVLDRLAEFAKNLTDSNGELIPIIFRPFHEANLRQKWWATNNAANNTYEEVKSLWRFTVEYLRDTKGVHNFLYAFAASCRYTDFYTDNKYVSGYNKTYPGDDFVDVMAVDCYSLVRYEERVPEFVERVRELVLEAEGRGKVPAIGAMGLVPRLAGGVDEVPDFWRERVLSPLKESNITTRLAYIMTFANRCAASECEVYVPYPGHVGEKDFKKFFDDPTTLFQGDLPDLYTES